MEYIPNKGVLMSTIKTKTSLLRALMALKEVIDMGQIQAAADKNGIKHSNLSKMITDLEERFKTVLLIRSPSGCSPTNATRQLYADIEVITDMLDKITKDLVKTDELVGSILLWTEEGFFGSTVLLEVSKMYAKHPNIRLDVMTTRTVNMANPDVSIVDTTVLQKIPGKTLFKFKTKAKFYATKEYLEKYGVPRNMDDMLENHDLFMRQKFLNQSELQFISKRAKKLNTVSDSPSIIYQLVCDNDGIALMPEWCMNKINRLIEVPNIDFSYEFYLMGVANPKTLKTPKVRAFLDLFYDICKRNDIELEMFDF